METTVDQTTVGEIMTADPISVTRCDGVRELALVLGANEISAAPVVDFNDTLVGIVSKTDLVRHCVEEPFGSRGESFWSLIESGAEFGLEAADLGTVSDIMTADPVTTTRDERIGSAAHRMAEHGLHHLVVIDDDRHPVGIVSTLDVLARFPL